MKSWLFSLCALLTFLISAEIARAESTYSRWLQTKKAAEQAIFDQQYNLARMLLEGISADVPQIGPLAIAKHAEMLSIALLELQKFPEAMATVMAGIDQMGPNPIGVRPRILLGLLLNAKRNIYSKTPFSYW